VRAPASVSQGLPGDTWKEVPTSSATCPKEEKEVATYDDEIEGTGWLIFAASMLGLAGILSIIDGIVALSKSRFYTASAVYVFSDLRTWGWITLIIGVLAIVAAMGVLSGSGFARWFGMIGGGLVAIEQFAFMQAYPFWSLTIFACSLLVIYALARYGGKRATA
jgi:hypothetical protein